MQKRNSYDTEFKVLPETLIAASNGKYNLIGNFTSLEPMVATNNYDQVRL